MPLTWTLIADLQVSPGSTVPVPGSYSGEYFLIEATTDSDAEPEGQPGYIRAVGDLQAGLIAVLGQKHFFTDERGLFRVTHHSLVSQFELSIHLFDFVPDDYNIKVWQGL